jgi:hypothetical protein
MSDRPLTGKALKALFREWAHDYGLRRLQERGVRYQDEPNRPLDDVDNNHRMTAPARRARFQQKDNAKDQGR